MNKILVRLLAMALTAFLAYVAIGADAAPAKVIDEKGCKLSIPAGWQVGDGKSYGVNVMIFAPTVGKLAPNIGLLVARPFPDFGYDTVAKALRDHMQASIQGFQLIAQRTVSVDGHRAIETTGYETIPQAGVQAKFDQYFILGKDHSYAIALTAPAGNAARYEVVFSQVIRSLRFAG